MDDQGFPVNSYLFSTTVPYRFHAAKAPCHISECAPRDHPRMQHYIRLHELHEALINQISKGQGAEPITLDMAAARQREADRLNIRTGLIVIVTLVSAPAGAENSCKLVLPDLKDTWELNMCEYMLHVLFAVAECHIMDSGLHWGSISLQLVSRSRGASARRHDETRPCVG